MANTHGSGSHKPGDSEKKGSGSFAEDPQRASEESKKGGQHAHSGSQAGQKDGGEHSHGGSSK